MAKKNVKIKTNKNQLYFNIIISVILTVIILFLLWTVFFNNKNSSKNNFQQNSFFLEQLNKKIDDLNKTQKENIKHNDLEKIINNLDKKIEKKLSQLNQKKEIKIDKKLLLSELNIDMLKELKKYKENIKKEILAEVNALPKLTKEIIITKINDNEAKSFTDNFWKFIKYIADKDIDNAVQYFNGTIYNFKTGNDIKKEDMKETLNKFAEKSILNIDNYEKLIQINSVYFFKSGFRPPLTERISDNEQLIVYSIHIDKSLSFPFPSDDNGEVTVYWVNKPNSKQNIFALGILSDILKIQ